MSCSENKLISGIKNRNTHALDAIVKEYAKPVYYLAYRILNIGSSKEDIEECVSDVFLEVWNKIEAFDAERGSFKTWIFMLTKYSALGYKRKMDKNLVVFLEDREISSSDNPEQEVIALETQEIILSTINNFNNIDRQLFLRRYFIGDEISDLMEMFSLSRSAIDNRLLRGRNKIKEVISYDGIGI